MKSLRDLISSVYGEEQVKHVLTEISRLLEKYEHIEDSKYTLSEKDVMLISYGDQLTNGKLSRLGTLKMFLDEQLDGLIPNVHILPFYPYTSDDGFSVTDYYAINQELGDWTDIQEISQDYRVMFDGVINHTSQHCEWFEKYLKDDPQYADYYVEVDDLDAYRNVVRPRTSPLAHEFSSDCGPKNIWTTFSRDQVDLNYSNPKVFIQILDLLLFYISRGAKLIRLDAIGFMWKEPNTTCIHLPQTHALIKAFRNVIDQIAPSTLLITETNVPHHENVSYFGDGDEAHMVYNFALPPLLAYSILRGDVSKFLLWAQSLELPTGNVCFFNFLASHDGIGVRAVDGILNDYDLKVLMNAAEVNGGRISYRSNSSGTDSPYEINCNYFSLLKGQNKDSEIGFKRMILAHAILLTMPGVPAIYFHSLVGSENDLEALSRGEANRAVNREKLNYTDLKVKLDDPSSLNHKILNEIKSLISLRSEHSLFHPLAHFHFDMINKHVLVIKRTMEDSPQQLTAYFNLSAAEQTVEIDRPGKDIKRDQTIQGDQQLTPYGFIWLLN